MTPEEIQQLLGDQHAILDQFIADNLAVDQGYQSGSIAELIKKTHQATRQQMGFEDDEQPDAESAQPSE